MGEGAWVAVGDGVTSAVADGVTIVGGDSLVISLGVGSVETSAEVGTKREAQAPRRRDNVTRARDSQFRVICTSF